MLARNLQTRAASATFLALSARPDSDQRSMRASWPDWRQSIDPPPNTRAGAMRAAPIAWPSNNCGRASRLRRIVCSRSVSQAGARRRPAKPRRADMAVNGKARAPGFCDRIRSAGSASSPAGQPRLIPSTMCGRISATCGYFGIVRTGNRFVVRVIQASSSERKLRRAPGERGRPIGQRLATTGGAVSFRQRRDPS